MAIDYLDEDYTITLYSYNKNQHKTLVSEYKTENTVTQNVVTQSILNNYTWKNATTGSTYATWDIISGGTNLSILNSGAAASYADLGSRVEIRGDEVYANLYRSSTSEKNNGIAIFKSASAGWSPIDFIVPPTASVSDGDADYIALEFSLYEDQLVIPSLDLAAGDSKLYIYKSSSAGWAESQILTTGSYNVSASADDDDGRYAYMNSRIHGNTIFANGFLAGADRFVAFFNSSSVDGWQLEKEVQVAAVSSDTNASMGISGLAFDFDGRTAVMGSKDGESAHSYQNNAGKIYIFNSASTGWAQVEKFGLSGSGLVADVSSTFGSNYDVEYRAWTRFGYKSVVVSGSYIAAAAQGVNIYNSGLYYRQAHSVFIFKSSSAGWGHERRINDPATNLITSASSSGDTNDTEFGTGLYLRDNALVINSPEWQSDWSNTKTQGRSYVYASSSTTGWTLDQTIDNPYSGSSFESDGSSGTNMKLGYSSQTGYPNAGGVGYGSKPAMSGNLLILNAPTFSEDTDASTVIMGAFIPLFGSGSYYQQEITEYTTESVTTTWVSSSNSGNPPFRLNTNTVQNIREQTPTNSYKTFIGEQKT